MKVSNDPRLGFDNDVQELKRNLMSVLRESAAQINASAAGSIDAHDAFATVPTSGSWKKGDFVKNSNPVEAGIALSKYVITGWIRITSGAGNVINTDWLACRSLTGN